MESVIVGRNVRTWFVKFGSSRTKLVILGMAMCLNSQMLVLITLDSPFPSVRIILPVAFCWIGSAIPILSLIQILYQKMKSGSNMFVLVWEQCSPEKLAWKEMECEKTSSEDGGQERQLKGEHRLNEIFYIIEPWHWCEFNQNTIEVEGGYLCDKLLAFQAGANCQGIYEFQATTGGSSIIISYSLEGQVTENRNGILPNNDLARCKWIIE